ncbi:MAG: RsmG family class I SAM-dependent methyltransferase [Myxococcota bacterium]
MQNGPSSRLLEVHRDLLERWRKVMNLVGPGPLDVHYEDCERALVGFEPRGRWADLGTGAGFPGIPFAARFPDVQVELVDSRQKRCRFLEEVVAEAGATQVTVRRARHEELETGAYDGVMSRALTAPDAMVDAARRLLVPGGTAVLFLQDDAPVPEAPDFEVFHVEHYEVEGKHRKSVALRFTPR